MRETETQTWEGKNWIMTCRLWLKLKLRCFTSAIIWSYFILLSEVQAAAKHGCVLKMQISKHQQCWKNKHKAAYNNQRNFTYKEQYESGNSMNKELLCSFFKIYFSLTHLRPDVSSLFFSKKLLLPSHTAVEYSLQSFWVLNPST